MHCVNTEQHVASPECHCIEFEVKHGLKCEQCSSLKWGERGCSGAAGRSVESVMHAPAQITASNLKSSKWRNHT